MEKDVGMRKKFLRQNKKTPLHLSLMGCTCSTPSSKQPGLFSNDQQSAGTSFYAVTNPVGPQGVHPVHLASIQGEWTHCPETCYTKPEFSPQYLFCPATSGDVEVCLTAIGRPTSSFGVALLDLGGFRVDKYDNSLHALLSSFSWNATTSEIMTVQAGKAYTILTVPYDCNATGAFQLSVCHEGTTTPVPVTQPLRLLGPVTQTQHLASLAAQKAQGRHKSDAARREVALHSMRAKAEASPNGSPLRAHWEDFVAASAKVEELRAEARRTGKRYSDGWSGPTAIGNDWPAGSEGIWKDMSEIAPFPTIVEDGFSPEDVQQGNLGDCYFISCLSHLVNDNCVLDSVFVTAEANPEGVYCVRLWVNDAWKHFFLDGTFPCSRDAHRKSPEDPSHWFGTPDPKSGKYYYPIAVHSSSMNEFWPCLLEKAWARLHGSYSKIVGGRVSDNDNTSGFPLTRFIPHCLPGIYEEVPQAHLLVNSSGRHNLDAEKLWEKLLKWERNHWLMTANAQSMNSLEEIAEARRAGMEDGVDKDGIVRDHAFTVLRCFLFVRGGSTPPLRLIQFRNPHGKGEWTGPYSDTDLKSWSTQLRVATQYSPENSGDDGIFWMPLEIVLEKFDTFNITPVVMLRNEGGVWHKAVVRGIFLESQRRTGYGSLNDSTLDSFSITLSSSTDLHVSFNLMGSLDVGQCAIFPVCDILYTSGTAEHKRYGASKGAGDFVIEAATSTLHLEPAFGKPLGKSKWEYTLTLCAATPFEVKRTTTKGIQKVTSPPLPLLSDILPGAPPPLSPIPQGSVAAIVPSPTAPPTTPSSLSLAPPSAPKPAQPSASKPVHIPTNFSKPPSFLPPKPIGGGSPPPIVPRKKISPFTSV